VAAPPGRGLTNESQTGYNAAWGKGRFVENVLLRGARSALSTMTDPHAVYANPLVARYASRAMAELWGDARKFTTWRKMWVALAEAERQLGLPVTAAQVDELKAHVDDIDFEVAGAYERKLRHDVMAHVHTYGDACPTARPIIHLGATSAFITDNTDLILLREALTMIRDQVVLVVNHLARFAAEQRATATLGLTHLQPAQPTTVGKRACLWAYDLTLDLTDIEHRRDALRARSAKGTTGTQASFLRLFDGDHQKVVELERLVAEKIGFPATYAVTGQTYPRKVDAQIVGTLGQIAASAHKAATDLRLLASRREIEEPFETDQIGSSAMAYKRNPMRSERICGLARYLMSLSANGLDTLATQWMERTLDDSANRRLVLPQAFLTADAVLRLYANVTAGLVVHPAVIASNLQQEIPLLATENILMAATASGGDRQTLHARIRCHSQAAMATVKEQGGRNDLLDRLAADPAFHGVDLQRATEPQSLIGRAAEQVDEFITDIVAPIRGRYRAALDGEAEIDV
jgi:adenylosuccinate lyase